MEGYTMTTILSHSLSRITENVAHLREKLGRDGRVAKKIHEVAPVHGQRSMQSDTLLSHLTRAAPDASSPNPLDGPVAPSDKGSVPIHPSMRSVFGDNHEAQDRAVLAEAHAVAGPDHPANMPGTAERMGALLKSALTKQMLRK